VEELCSSLPSYDVNPHGRCNRAHREGRSAPSA
jgi:hypothetical protein